MKNDNHNIQTAIIYTRVSSKEQLDGFSLESQEKICRAYAERNTLTVLAIFREEGESAKTADRTELQKLLRYTERHRKKIGKIVVYKVDRLSRNNEDYYALRVIFSKLGVELRSATEPIDDTPLGKLTGGILSAISEFDNSIRASRTAEGMKTRLRNGLYSFGAPLGYRNITDSMGNKIMEPHPEKSIWIKTIFEEYAKGIYSFKDVAGLVNKLGLKTKHNKKVYSQRVAKILKNPIYYGKIEVPKWDISILGKHAPIISEELFSRAQRILNGEKSDSRKLPRNRDNPDFPLRGIQCNGCERNLSGGWVTSKTKKRHPYYGCIYTDCPQKRSIRKKELEDNFTEFLTKLRMENKEISILREAIKLAYKTEARSIISNNKRVESEIDKLKDQRQSLLDLKLRDKDIMSDEEFKKERERLSSHILELEMSKMETGFADFNVDAAIDFAFELLRSLPENWQSLEVNELRVLRSILFPKNLVYMYPGIKTPELACIFKLKPTSNEEKEPLVALRRIELLFSP